MSNGKVSNDYDLVDLIAQAVIDRLDERERMNRLADIVIERIARIKYQTKLATDVESSKDDLEDKIDGNNQEQ